MKQQYILPNTYASEKDRYQTYRAVIRKEKPTAAFLSGGNKCWRYFAETSIGTIFFQISGFDLQDGKFGETEQATDLLQFIMI